MSAKHPVIAHLLVAGCLAGAWTLPAHADSLTMAVQYFTVAESGDPDFNTNPCCSSVYTNEVLGQLGPDGLPAYNNTGSYTGPTLYDVNANGELTWWTPSSTVTATGSGTITLPYVQDAYFPPNGTGSDDDSGFQAAIFTATLVVPTSESVTFTFGADDDAFLALGNTVISQIGGIHGVTPAPVTTTVLDAGSYSLELFYTDRHNSGAGINFSVDTEGVTVAPPAPPVSSIPEPASAALMLAGLAGLGVFARRRRG